MKRSLFAIITLLGFGIIAIAGCGSGPGSPGSQGSGDTGVMLDAFIVPTYNGTNTSSVDAVQDICSTTSNEGVVTNTVEFFADHTATVTINSRLLNPNTTFTPGTLYVEKYTIQYRRNNDSISAPPIESDTRFETIVITPPVGAATNTVTATIEFFDLIRKDKYHADILSGQYTSRLLNNYTATITFEGQNQFGTKFSFQANAAFQIGDFDNCQ